MGGNLRYLIGVGCGLFRLLGNIYGSQFMAIDKHIDILLQGVEKWNAWRKENPDVTPDLSYSVFCSEGGRHASLCNGWDDEYYLRPEIYHPIAASCNEIFRADPIYVEVPEIHLKKLDDINLNKSILNGCDFSNYLSMNNSEISNSKMIKASLPSSISRSIMSNSDARGALFKDHMTDVDFSSTNLEMSSFDGQHPNLSYSKFTASNLKYAGLSGCGISHCDFWSANLTNASMVDVVAFHANFTSAKLIRTNLSYSDLSSAIFINTDMSNSNISHSRIFGTTAWDANLENANQKDLIISLPGEPTLTVDDLEMAQLIYLLRKSNKLRSLIDTLTAKVVLILGRFDEQGMATLKIIKKLLKNQNLIPIIFDFEKPSSRDLTETVLTIASISKLVIADISNVKSVPQELQAIVPNISVTVQPILLEDESEYGMFSGLQKYPWVNEVIRFGNHDDLTARLLSVLHKDA
jgi:uncharacterized protein YjbI with pentapeptide repeats